MKLTALFVFLFINCVIVTAANSIYNAFSIIEAERAAKKIYETPKNNL